RSRRARGSHRRRALRRRARRTGRPSREPSRRDYTIDCTLGLVDAIKGAFSFLSSRTQTEERVAQYVIREHHRGRPLHDVLEDHYVTNRLRAVQIKRLLGRPLELTPLRYA